MPPSWLALVIHTVWRLPVKRLMPSFRVVKGEVLAK